MDTIYEPREDSFLLGKHVKKRAFGNVLDMGTGSGFQAMLALGSRKVKSVLAVDVNQKAVDYVKEIGIRAVKSDMFSKIDNKFDTIIFNPPYLPDDPRIKDVALDGGKEGYELLERFLKDASSHLRAEGMMLIVFSTLTKKAKVDELLGKYCYEFKQLEVRKLDFEKLYVYKIVKSEVLKFLEKRGISHVRRFAKGHRGNIFIGRYHKKKAAVKMQRKDIHAKGTVNNEIKKLKILNQKNIGPKLMMSGEDYFVYQFVEGKFIPDFLENATKKDTIWVLKEVFRQMRVMDKLGMNKEEMHHPYKHVIVGKKVALLDFERCKFSQKPHNVTQFCQYVTSKNIQAILKKKNINIDKKKMIELAKVYKHDMTEANFKKIVKMIW